MGKTAFRVCRESKRADKRGATGFKGDSIRGALARRCSVFLWFRTWVSIMGVGRHCVTFWHVRSASRFFCVERIERDVSTSFSIDFVDRRLRL